MFKFIVVAFMHERKIAFFYLTFKNERITDLHAASVTDAILSDSPDT